MLDVNTILNALDRVAREFESHRADQDQSTLSAKPSQRYTRYVHGYITADGETRYAVGEWVEQRKKYWRPHDRAEYLATGLNACFCERIEECQYFPTRAQALRRARYLWGERKAHTIEREAERRGARTIPIPYGS